MKQISLGLDLSTKKTRKREFLEQMEKVDLLEKHELAPDMLRVVDDLLQHEGLSSDGQALVFRRCGCSSKMLV